MTFSSTPITVKDSAAADKSLIAYNDGTSSAFAHPLLDNTGAIISPATSGKQDIGNTALGTPADAAVTNPASTASIIAALKGILTAVANILPKGQSTMANSAPVVLASDQTLPLPTGAATAANQATGNASLATVATNTANIPAKGSATSANSLPVVIASDQGALPLPTGASTAANQATGNSALSTIATNTAGLATAAAQTTASGKLDSIIANTGAGSVNLTNTPTVTAGAYTTGMVAGGKQSLAGAVRASGGSGIIQSVSVTKKTALTAPYDVYFFHTDPTNSTFTDNSTLALNVADIPFLIGVAHCTDLVSNGTPQTLQANNVGLPFKLATGTSIFAVAVIRGAETLASTSAIVLNVAILQD